MEEKHDDEWRSIRDPRIPLGIPRAARPEYGPSVQEYFKHKHTTVGPGRFYGAVATVNKHTRKIIQMFKKYVPTPEHYTQDDLRKDVAAALQRARQAGVHSVVCQRIIHAVADSEAVRRATMEAVI
jgi:hypothetical protein